MRSQPSSRRLPDGDFPRTPYPFRFLEFPPFEASTEVQNLPTSSELSITNLEDHVPTTAIVASSNSPQKLSAEIADVPEAIEDFSILTGPLGDPTENGYRSVATGPELDDYEPSIDQDNFSLTEAAVDRLIRKHLSSHEHEEYPAGSEETATISLELKGAGLPGDYSTQVTPAGTVPTTKNFSPSIACEASSPLLKRKSPTSDPNMIAHPRKRRRVFALSPIKIDIEPPHQWVPTPVSPDRQFVSIIAERPSREGTLYKVVWRDSWVHESALPDLEPVKLYQVSRNGKAWDVLAGDSLDSSSC